MLRFLMTATGLVLIAATVSGFLLSPQLERYAVPWLEHSASGILGAPVTCEKIRLVPLLPGLELAQVQVMAKEEAGKPLLTCERVAIRLDPATVFQPHPALTEVVLDGLVLHLRPGDGKDESLTRFVSGLADRASAAGLEVRKVRCINGRVSVADNLLPGDGLTFPLDAFELKAGQGATGATVSLAALRRMLTPLGEEAKGPAGLRELVKDLSERLQAAGSG